LSMGAAGEITAIEGNSLSSSTEACSDCACHCVSPQASARGREPLSLLPVLALVLLPKCPLCFAAWFGVLGSLGAASWLRSIWGAPLAIMLLSLAVGSLALGARISRDSRPLVVGILGAAALLSGKYGLEAPLLVYAGVALLTGASFWSNWLQSYRTSRFGAWRFI
jgi:hypothetical protein